MKAVVVIPGRLPCLVFHTGRSGLSVKVKTYCGEKVSAGDDGVYQVRDDAKVCAECEEKCKTMEM